MKKKRILLLAYMISPYRGSEYCVAWNHVLYLSKFYAIDVVYGCSGDHMGDNDDLEHYLIENKVENVSFIFVKPSKLASFLNVLNKKNILRSSFYLAYRVWHKDAYAHVRLLPNLSQYDFVHYLNPIGYREPGFLWRLPLPYIWGPIGGAISIKTAVQPSLPIKAKLQFCMRNIINHYQLYFSKRISHALTSADIVLTATTENKRCIHQSKGILSLHLPENGPVGVFVKDRRYYYKNKLNLIWVGTLEYRKNLQLLLDVIDRCEKSAEISVVIVGNGPLYDFYRDNISKNGTYSCISMLGGVTRTEVADIFNKSDLHVITSMSEGNPTTLWEALASGVPTISLDINGMKDTINTTNGFLISHDAPYETIVEEFAQKIDQLCIDHDIIPKMKEGIRDTFDKNHWRHRERRWQEIYDLLENVGLD